MLAKQVVLSQIEILPNGLIQVRLEKQVNDSGMVLSRAYHRTICEPGVDPDGQLNVVDVHLAQMGFPAIPQEVRKQLRQLVQLVHTPEVVAAYKAAQQVA